MKKNAFTLIELLAVIVILAIIAIIATPIVLNIIKVSNENAVKQSATTYIKAVEQGYVSKLTQKEKMENGDYDISTLDTLGIRVKGDKPSGDDDYVTLQNGKVIDYSLTIKGYNIYYNDGDMIVDSGQDKDSKNKITPLDHTITFMVDKEVYEVVSVKDGNLVNAPSEPSKDDLHFSWWIDESGNSVSFPFVPTENTELKAYFQKVRSEMEVTEANTLLGSCNGANYKQYDGVAILGYGYMSASNASKGTAMFLISDVSENNATISGWTPKSIIYDGKTYYYSCVSTTKTKTITDGVPPVLVSEDIFDSRESLVVAILDYYFYKI